jgi:hypothetical protein
MLKALAAVLADARYPSSQALVAKVIAACSDNFGAAGGAAAASAHPHSTGASSHIAAATNAGMCSLRPSGIPAVESHLSIPPPCHCFCGRDDPPLPARQAERISSTPGVLRCLNELLRDGTATFAESGIHAPAPRPPARQLAAVAAAASLSDHAGSRPLLRAATGAPLARDLRALRRRGRPCARHGASRGREPPRGPALAPGTRPGAPRARTATSMQD